MRLRYKNRGGNKLSRIKSLFRVEYFLFRLHGEQGKRSEFVMISDLPDRLDFKESI